MYIMSFGHHRKWLVTVTLERDEAIVLIKGVPAEVCNNCGHYYRSEHITRLVRQKVTRQLKVAQN